MRLVPAREARAALAAHLLGPAPRVDTVGEITLHPHQRDAVERITQLLERYRGALLADDVGLGKTYVALAVAAAVLRQGTAVVVIAPAAIRHPWIEAAARARVPIAFHSVEMLGRRGPPGLQPDLVVIDEAHHLRSSTTKRFLAASTLCRSGRVLLLSATPVQNSVDDLRTVLSLFLGAAAQAMSVDDLARYVVRRVTTDTSTAGTSPALLPTVSPTVWLQPIEDADCLDRILNLPRAVPPRDGDDGGMLLTYTLVRQWASSRAALRGALQRRLARAHALEDALMAGRLPTRAELNAWTYADGVQQLAFPEIAAPFESREVTELLEPVRAHAAGVRDLIGWIANTPDPDEARANQIRDIMRRHPGERMVAFSEYADTIDALFRRMAPTTRAAMLTHAAGRVSGGTIRRAEILERFAPGSSARTPVRDCIDLLLTTDVLSEGVNLQDASVVLHLDLTWNPARLEQRVGRLRRIGAARESISVYMFAPPLAAERMLHLEQRLRLKLGAAARTVGIAGAILPGLATDTRDAAAPREERIATVLRTWQTRTDTAEGAVLAGVSSRIEGALACVRSGTSPELIGIIDGRVTESRASIERLLDAVTGNDVPFDPIDARRSRELLEHWLRRQSVCDVVDLPALRVARSRRALLRRVDTIAKRAPRHRQSDLGPLMHAARTAATATLSVGAERVLNELTHCEMSDVAWLQAVGEFAALHARGDDDSRAELLVLLILKRTDATERLVR